MQVPRLTVVLDETAQVESYQTEGASPMSGNNDRGVDQIATALVDAATQKILRRASRRARHHARPTLLIADAVEHHLQPSCARQPDLIDREVRGA